MTGAWTKVLLAFSALTRAFSWPGALQTDGRAISAHAGVDFADGERLRADAQRLSPDAQRLSAIDRLIARHGLEAATPFLAPLLGDREPTVRFYAARLLARAGASAATAAATAWIMTPVVPLVDRTFGLDVLGQAPTLSLAARAAVELAGRDPDATIRARALEVLERHPIAPSLPVVLGALDDDNREVRLRAVRLAGAAGDPRATLPLLDRLDDSDRQVRVNAIHALSLLGDLRATPALLRLLADETMDVRAAAIDALGALKARATVPSLIALAQRRTDDLAHYAQLALGQIATPAAIGALIEALRSPLAAEEVTVALRHAGAAAVGPLIREVDGGPPSSAVLAARLLGEIGDRRATLPICAAIERGADGGPIILPALDALARLADPASVPTLARSAESPDAEIRQHVFAALLSIADPRSVAVLDGGFVDPDARVRELAARLAARIDAHQAVWVLAPLVSDGDPSVRRAAAEALARVANPSSQLVTLLLAALTQPQSPPRDDGETAAFGDAMEAITSGEDADPLARAFATARGGARTAIARGLATAHAERSLSDRAVIDPLIAALADGDLLALAAADALGVARIPAGAVAALARAFADAEPMVRARLCPAIASTPDGGPWLATLIATPDEAPEVRAAAAWAARGRAEARSALEAAAREGDGVIAQNARAALSAAARPATGWTAVRLRGPDESPLVGRWVTIGDGGGIAVAAVTDSLGVARIPGLGGARLDLRAAGLTLRRDGP
jgi:HEAT repeat protein